MSMHTCCHSYISNLVPSVVERLYRSDDLSPCFISDDNRSVALFCGVCVHDLVRVVEVFRQKEVKVDDNKGDRHDAVHGPPHKNRGQAGSLSIQLGDSWPVTAVSNKFTAAVSSICRQEVNGKDHGQRRRAFETISRIRLGGIKNLGLSIDNFGYSFKDSTANDHYHSEPIQRVS